MRSKYNPPLIIVLAVSLLLPALTRAKDVEGYKVLPWKGDVITVYDYMPDAWNPLVRDMVDDFDAALRQAGGPRMVYVDRDETPCLDLAFAPYISGVIWTCAKDDPSGTGHASSKVKKGKVVAGSLDLAGQRMGDGRYVLCHEMMHALTHIKDDYGAQPESCVLGDSSTLGTWDTALLAALYGDTGKHKKHHR